MNTTIELLAELRGTECRCGRSKKARQTFCAGCYYSLPQSMRARLYWRIGQGYEEAYQDAVDLLQKDGE